MRITVLCLAAMVLAGCGVELLTTTAIQGELQAENLKAATRQLGRVGNQMGEARLRGAINAYQAETGAYPPSLDVLAPAYIPAVPVKADGTPYYYDPATGTLTDGPAAVKAVTAQDQENMNVLQRAITQYGRSTGYYPASLQILVQYRYLNDVPQTSSGQDFIYYPQNGSLYHPAALARQGTPGTGGLSVLGDAITGLSVRKELNRMGSPGASSAGGYARGGLQNTTNRHNQRQQQALDDLDL